MPTILVVEDEADIRAVVDYNLQQAGYTVVQAETAAQGLELARKHHPDIILLDLMLPDRPGTEVCRELKKDAATHNIPIVFVTARSEEIDRVVGFELGAEDYVVKPFSVRELLLRVQAILRRKGPVAERNSGESVEFGVLRFDREAHRIWVADAEAELTSLEFRLLCTLYDRRDRVQSREVLLTDVWGLHGDLQTRTVDTHVKRLREKLGPAGDYIETVRGVGYRFVPKPGP